MLRLYVPNDYMLKIKGEIIFRVFLTIINHSSTYNIYILLHLFSRFAFAASQIEAPLLFGFVS